MFFERFLLNNVDFTWKFIDMTMTEWLRNAAAHLADAK
jgi:hypothetical protein